MLLDNAKDPYQLNNLMHNAEFAGLIQELDSKTDQLLIEASDPEDPAYFS